MASVVLKTVGWHQFQCYFVSPKKPRSPYMKHPLILSTFIIVSCILSMKMFDHHLEILKYHSIQETKESEIRVRNNKSRIPFQYRLEKRSNHPASGSVEPWLPALKSCITTETLSFPYSVSMAFSDSAIFPCWILINVISHLKN